MPRSRTRTRSPNEVRVPIRVLRCTLPRRGLHSRRVGRRGRVRPLRQDRLRHKPHQQSQRKSANNFQPLHLSAIVLLRLLIVLLVRLLFRGYFVQRIKLAQHVVIFQHVQILDHLKLLLLVLRATSQS